MHFRYGLIDWLIWGKNHVWTNNHENKTRKITFASRRMGQSSGFPGFLVEKRTAPFTALPTGVMRTLASCDAFFVRWTVPCMSKTNALPTDRDILNWVEILQKRRKTNNGVKAVTQYSRRKYSRMINTVFRFLIKEKYPSSLGGIQ